MKKSILQIQLITLAAFTLTLAYPIVARADSKAHALYALGVNIGLAEATSIKGTNPSVLAEYLQFAGNAARKSGCIADDEIEALRATILRDRTPIVRHVKIRSYRERLATQIDRNCQCVGGGSATVAASCTMLDWIGKWKTGNGLMTFGYSGVGRHIGGKVSNSKTTFGGNFDPNDPCAFQGTWSTGVRTETGYRHGRFKFNMTGDRKSFSGIIHQEIGPRRWRVLGKLSGTKQ